MRRLLPGLGLLAPVLALSACAQPQLPNQVYPVFFREFSATLDDTGTEIVANAASIARQFPSLPVRVSGYADRAGSPQADIDISKRRADAVADLLQRDGVAAARLSREAVGTPPDSQPGPERRRVEIDIGS